jgi:acyl-coenzyme A thioesterase 13
MSDLPPDGFERLTRKSPFLELIGPVWYRTTGDAFLIGLRAEEKHCNARGIVHGGVLMTLADISLGYRSSASQDPPANLTTANMTVDFAGSANLGDWIEVDVDIQRVGRRMAFANAYITVGERRIVRASAVFARSDDHLVESPVPDQGSG